MVAAPSIALERPEEGPGGQREVVTKKKRDWRVRHRDLVDFTLYPLPPYFPAGTLVLRCN